MIGSDGNPLNYTASYQQMLNLAGYSAAHQASVVNSIQDFLAKTT
jgi:hypothetical protein